MATSGACDPTRPLHVQIWLAFRYRRRSLRLGTVSRRYVYARQNDRKVGAGRGGRIPPWRIRITTKFVASREMRLRAFAFREAGKINPMALVRGRRALNLPLEDRLPRASRPLPEAQTGVCQACLSPRRCRLRLLAPTAGRSLSA